MEMMMMSDDPWGDLKAEIDAAGGIKVMYMWQFRDASGWMKLGPQVIIDVARKMSDQDIGTLPYGEPLPMYGDYQVRVFLTTSRVGRMIDAVVSPSAKGDALLREIGADDSAEVLERVRQMICP